MKYKIKQLRSGRWGIIDTCGEQTEGDYGTETEAQSVCNFMNGI